MADYSLGAIRTEHSRLEGMKATQSARIVNELRSDAHKHRGFLLEEVERLKGEIAQREMTISVLRAEIDSYWEGSD